ncbi:MAG TPA: hypothetical protein PLV68_10915, partial [Ilumatobacteraceae bacterium]|nr:hypothetical protein [Ilumatobacteraceae bacterium]
TSTGLRVVVAGAAPGPAFAVIRPQAISLARRAPVGSSVRNTWPGLVATIDRFGDRFGDRCRVSVDLQSGSGDASVSLVAEITV